MKISVCTDAVFGNIPTTQAIKTLSKIGINTIEFWGWWDKNLGKIYEAKEKYNVDIATMCTKFISLTDSEKRSEYIEGLASSITAAKSVGIKKLITQTGNDTGKDRAYQHESLVEGLRACVPLLEKEGITLLVEPLNTYIDHKGYYLYSSKEAFEIIDEVGSDNVKVLFDIYHQQIMEGNIINNITANIDKIGHFHAAGLPGRVELDLGELNYKKIFDAIDKSGYTEYVGLEYFPENDPVQGLLPFVK